MLHILIVWPVALEIIFMTCLYLMGLCVKCHFSEFLDHVCCSVTVVLEMLQDAECFDYLLKVFMLLSWQIKSF